jgi:hypothetical protein
LAVGLVHAVHDKPVDGDHTYDAAPEPASTVEDPSQILTLEPAVTFGIAPTLTVTDAVFVQPLASVPVTVYVVVAVGNAVGDAHDVHERPVEGDHIYDVAPVAASKVDVPLQTKTLAPALTFGFGFTNTTMVSVPVQPLLLVPVTIYVVVVTGLAVGLAQLVQDNPVDGVQV